MLDKYKVNSEEQAKLTGTMEDDIKKMHENSVKNVAEYKKDQ